MSAVHRQCHSVIGMPHTTDSDGVRHAIFRDSHPRIAGRHDGFPGFPVNTSICTPISQAASAFVTSPRTGWVIPIPSPASTLPSLPAMEESSSCLVNAAKSDVLQSSILFVIPSLPPNLCSGFYLIIFIIKHRIRIYYPLSQKNKRDPHFVIFTEFRRLSLSAVLFHGMIKAFECRRERYKNHGITSFRYLWH